MTTHGGTRSGRAHGWRPIVILVGVLFAVGLAAVTLAATLSSRDSNTAAVSCETGITQHVELVAAEGSASVGQLKDAARILRQRMATYGCGDVRVAGNRLQVSLSVAAAGHLDELIAPGQLQLREVLEVRSGTQCPRATRAQPDAGMDACSRDGSEQYRLGPAKLVGSDVKTATAQHDRQLGAWQVILRFTDSGQRRFTDLTTQLISKQLAIVLDGVVLTAPTIQETIVGDAQITGSFTKASANALATILEHGALPVVLRRA